MPVPVVAVHTRWSSGCASALAAKSGENRMTTAIFASLEMAMIPQRLILQ
jgi:hypothetical protein